MEHQASPVTELSPAALRTIEDLRVDLICAINAVLSAHGITLPTAAAATVWMSTIVDASGERRRLRAELEKTIVSLDLTKAQAAAAEREAAEQRARADLLDGQRLAAEAAEDRAHARARDAERQASELRDLVGLLRLTNDLKGKLDGRTAELAKIADVDGKPDARDARIHGLEAEIKERDEARAEVTKLLGEIRYLTTECDELRRGASALIVERDEARAELRAIEEALEGFGPRDGLLLIDRITSLVVQRRADEGRCDAWQREYEEQRQRAEKAEAERDEARAKLAEETTRADQNYRDLQAARAAVHALEDWRADVTVAMHMGRRRPGDVRFADVPQHIRDLVRDRDRAQGELLGAEARAEWEEARADKAEKALAEATTWRPMAELPDEGAVLLRNQHACDVCRLSLSLAHTLRGDVKYRGWLPIPPYRAKEEQ